MPASSSAGASTAATRHPSAPASATDVGEVVFALGIVGAHRLQPAPHIGGAGAQHAGVAQVDRALFLAGVGPFDDALDEAVAHDHAAVAAGIGGTQRQQRQARVIALALLQQAAQRVGADQRVVGVEHRHLAVAEMLRGGQRGVRGAQAFVLHHAGVRRRLALHRLHAGPTTTTMRSNTARSLRAGGAASSGRRSGAASSAAPTSCACRGRRPG